MSQYKRVLCPVDLSENSLAVIQLATTIAKQYGAKVSFFYVAPHWLPEESMFGSDYIRSIVEENRKQLDKLRPTDESVSCDHEMVHGNAGPEVVRASKTADTIVMSTHGRTGLARFVMGSVAQYVLRNAECPVILIKGNEIAKGEEPTQPSEESQTFITEVMHHVAPVQGRDRMDMVLAELEKANESAAPVVNDLGECIGILTTSDIERYHSLKVRFENKDESVVDEMFEVDKYGQRRPTNFDFDHVERHMTKRVISIENSQSVQKAIELFEANPKIHHLVVMDDADHAVGIVDVLNLTRVKPLKEEEKA